MPRNINLSGLNLGVGTLDWKDPRVFMRFILGALLVGNLVALGLLLYPPGGSLEDVDARYNALRQQSTTQARNLEQLRTLASRVAQSRKAGEKFLDSYFMERRKAASTIVGELTKIAKEAGIRPREHSFLLEPIEGADDLSMMTVNGAYEGTYADLVLFVNRIDRSPRFLLIDSLSAAPQQQQGVLNISIRFHVFVRELPGT